ncbi:MAG: EpsG family protein [Synergistaceae bacterium]|nr:EpsG family protein [Synergistaceae bacterium]
MIMYAVFLVIPFLLYIKIKSINKKSVLFFSMFLLWLFSSLRDGTIGADYPVYIYYFKQIAVYKTAYFREKGYVLFNYLISLISTHYIVLAGFINAMFFVPLYYYIHKNVDKKYWGLALFLFVANPYMYVQTSFNILRQCCASGILLFAAESLKKNKKILFVIWVLLASQFHRSALGAFTLLLITHVHWTRKKWFIVAIVSFLLSILPIQMIINYVALFFGYGGYTTFEASLLNNPAYILLISFYVFVLCRHYNALFTSSSEKFFIDIFMFTSCFLLFAIRNDAFYRVRIIFSLIALPAVPIIFNNRKKYKSFGIYGLIYSQLYLLYNVGFYCSYILYLFFTNKTNYVPFRFFF